MTESRQALDALASAPPAAPTAGASQPRYRLTIHRPSGQQAVEVVESQVTAALRPLLAELTRRAGLSRNQPGSRPPQGQREAEHGDLGEQRAAQTSEACSSGNLAGAPAGCGGGHVVYRVSLCFGDPQREPGESLVPGPLQGLARSWRVFCEPVMPSATRRCRSSRSSFAANCAGSLGHLNMARQVIT